jgi:hypothetical protein
MRDAVGHDGRSEEMNDKGNPGHTHLRVNIPEAQQDVTQRYDPESHTMNAWR